MKLSISFQIRSSQMSKNIISKRIFSDLFYQKTYCFTIEKVTSSISIHTLFQRRQ